jgi:hypothetical protein
MAQQRPEVSGKEWRWFVKRADEKSVFLSCFSPLQIKMRWVPASELRPLLSEPRYVGQLSITATNA